MKIVFAVLFSAALSTAAAAQTTPSPQPAAAPEVGISGWRLECASNSATLACQALDRVNLRTNNAVVAAVSVQLSGDGKTPSLLVQVPLGVAIAGAVRVGTKSGAVQSLPFATCTRDGCFARARLGDPLLNAMRAAKEPLQIAYELLDANSSARTITIAMGLDGFAATYDKLR